MIFHSPSYLTFDVADYYCSSSLCAAENRKILNEQEVEKCLVTLLGTDNDGTKIAASQAIAAMCENLASKQTIGTLGKSVMVEVELMIRKKIFTNLQFCHG